MSDSIKFKSLILFIIFMVLAIILIFCSFMNFKQNSEPQKAFSQMNKAEQLDENTTIGQKAVINSATVTKTQTGVGPFDENDEAGNDSTEDNAIVRSFDQLTWTVESTFKLKDSESRENLKGGIIQVEATLPSSLKGQVKWDLASMAWAVNAELTEDGTVFKACYKMSDSEITIPGKQNLIFIAKTDNAKNGTTIRPEIKVWLSGNEEYEKCTVSNINTVTVSAKPRYNIKLVRNTRLEKRTTFDYGQGDVNCRAYGYAVILQLYNQSQSKGMKGIEIPQGDITFDIDLRLTRSMVGSSEVVDITNQCTPILWNYKLNLTETAGKIAGRNMEFGRYTEFAGEYAPLAKITDRLSYKNNYTFDSGNINMEQVGSKIKTTISNYQFNGKFPKYDLNETGSIIYGDNVGCFSVGYFQILVPDNGASTVNNANYYLNVSDSNMNAKSISGTNMIEQMNTNDDNVNIQHVRYRDGTYFHSTQFYTYGENHTWLAGWDLIGQGKAAREQKIEIRMGIDTSENNDEPEDNLNTINRLQKFDGDAMEPIYFDDGSKYHMESKRGTMTFRLWYVTKKDGTNWTSAEEMHNANIEDLLMYNNIEDIPQNSICVGEYIESQSGYIAADGAGIYVPVKIKDTAKVGQTYESTHVSKYWKNKLDRSTYTATNSNVTWPTPDYYTLPQWRNYIKTEYNVDGTIVDGTNSGDSFFGDTVLIVDASLSLKKEILNVDINGNTKINYDIGKNEYDVTFRLTPELKKINADISGVNLRVEEELPAGLTYVYKSSNTQTDPEIINNADGSSKLVWYISNCVTGEVIKPIEYKVHINEETENGVIYQTKSSVREEVNENEIYKIGTDATSITKRIAKKSINVINLASYVLYKTTDTPLVQKNEEIHYKLVCINKKDETAPDFQLLDILPYNEDSRGTNFNGTYYVKSINITQTSSEMLKLYITNDTEIRNGATAKDDTIGTSSIWNEQKTEGEINQELTAFAIKGKLSAKERIEIDIILTPKGNRAKNIYKNSATARILKNTEILETAISTVIVDGEEEPIQPAIQKTAQWVDVKQGIAKIDINIKLIDPEDKDTQVAEEVGTEAVLTDVVSQYFDYYEDETYKSSTIPSSLTKESNNDKMTWQIGTVQEGTLHYDFYIKIKDEYTGGVYQTNTQAKFEYINIFGEKEEIIATIPEISRIIVHHYIKDTKEKVPSNIDGQVVEDEYIATEKGKEYTTLPASNVSNYYKLDSQSSNANGTMTSQVSEIYYWYKSTNGKISIIKYGEYSIENNGQKEKKKEPLEVGLKIYNQSEQKWITAEKISGEENLYNVKTQDATFDQATTIYTNKENGKLILDKLNTICEYTVVEVENNNRYYNENIKIGSITENANGNITNLSLVKATLNDVEYYGAKGIKVEGNNTNVVTIYNERTKGNLIIHKQDNITKDNLEAGFKIYSVTYNAWVTKNSEGEYQYIETDMTNAEEFVTNKQTGTIEINLLKVGEYKIVEVRAPQGYDITKQTGYDSQTGYVDLGIVNIENNNNNRTFTAENKKIVSIEGYVWKDDLEYNEFYDNTEEKLTKIQVNLRDITGNIVASGETSVENNYCYRLNNKIGGEPIYYWDLDNYYVEFIYDNQSYITVEPNLNKDLKNTSKAIEEQMEESELDDKLLNGTGKAITYIGDDKENYGLKNYYNEKSYKIEDINLGLKLKVNPTFEISENIAYVYFSLNGSEYKYNYAGTEQIPPDQQLKAPTEGFNRKINVSDICYNSLNPHSIKMYVAYRIDIKNTTVYEIEKLYSELNMQIDALVSTYDTYRYTLEDESWTSNQIGKAIYQGNDLSGGINPNEIKTVYIQFRVNDEAINELLTNNITQEADDSPTTAIARTYHYYKRRDYNWEQDSISIENQYTDNYNESIYKHESINSTKSAKAPTLNLILDENPRTISGIVFEDKKIDFLGNGLYDNTDGLVEDVKIELLEQNGDKYEKAKLYTLDEYGNPKEIESESYSDENGVYKIIGIIPNEYVLRYTYGDGNQQIKQIDGSVITDVSSDQYKSTIATEENTVKALKGEDIKNGKWYLNIDKDVKPSVALDILEKEKLIHIGENYKVYSREELDNESTDNKNIAADTANLSIGIEYDVATEGDGNKEYETEFNNINFGIILKPITKLYIEQEIIGGRVVLSNGMNYIEWTKNQNVKGVIDTGNKKGLNMLVEMNNIYIYGSTLEIQYLLKITNNSEINYNSPNYYWFGIKEGEENYVALNKVYDYLDPKLTYISNKNNLETEVVAYDNRNDDLRSLIEKINEKIQAEYNVEENYSSIISFKNVGDIYSTQIERPEGDTKETEKQIVFTATTVMGSNEKDCEYLNVAQIIEVDSNIPITNEYDSFSIKPISNLTSLNLIPPSGENKNLNKYIFILVSFTTIVIGVVIIKKKITKRV